MTKSINMDSFTYLVQNILNEATDLLVEMPVATRSKDIWIQSILNRLGSEGEKGWYQADLKRKEGSNQRNYFNAEVFIFKTFAKTITEKLEYAIDILSQQGVVTDLQTLKTNIEKILSAANLSNCTRSEEIKKALIDGLNEVPETNNSLIINADWFIEMFIVAVSEKLFNYIFTPNVKRLPVKDFYKRPEDVKSQGVLDFYNPSLDEATFIEQIQTALLTGINGNPPILPVVANEFGFKYKKHVHDLINTSRILAQCREEIVSDFETNHPTQKFK